MFYLAAVHTVLLAQEVLEAEREGFDGMLLGAATDSGLDEVRSLVKIPVVASVESSLSMSEFIGRKVGICTIGGAGEPTSTKKAPQIATNRTGMYA